MIYLLLNNGDPIKKDEKLDRIFPHLEEVGAEFVKDSAARKSNYRLIKTHLVRQLSLKFRQHILKNEKLMSQNMNNNIHGSLNYYIEIQTAISNGEI